MTEQADKRPRNRLKGLLGTFSSLALVAACNSAPTPSPDNPTPKITPSPASSGEVLGASTGPDLNLAFPFNDTWYYTGGPHFDGLSKGIRYAVDFSPAEVISCPGGTTPLNEIVTASESGKVIVAGDNNPQGANNSIVEIQDNNDFIVGYMHLDNIDVTVGQNVNTGDPLGNPSCKLPPGGDTTGVHLHEYLQDQNGNALPIAGTIFSGFEVQESPTNYNGLLVKGNDVRTADVGRFGPGAKADGLRNDVSNTETSINSTPSPTIENILAEPSIDNPLLGAKEKILQLWASTWEENIKIDDGGSILYVISHTPSLSAWYQTEKDNLLNGTETSTPLKITWNIAQEGFDYNDSKQAVGTKYMGEMEINNLQIISQEGVFPPLTDADKKNGISWGGSAQISYLVRSRALVYNGEDGLTLIWGKKSVVDNWITKDPTDPYPEFGPWQEGKETVDLIIVNGQWQIKQPFTRGATSEDPWDISQEFSMPDGSIRAPVGAPMNFGSIYCYNDQEAPCIVYNSDYTK